MTNKHNISSLSIEQIRKFVTKTMSESEQVQIESFLSQHPDLKISLEEMTLADLKHMEAVSSSVISKLPKRKSHFPYGSVAAILIVLVGSVWYFNSKDSVVDSHEIVRQEKEVPLNADTDTVQDIPDILLNKEVAVVVPEIDTFYTIKKKGKDFEFDIESTEEVSPNVETEIVQKQEGQDNLKINKQQSTSIIEKKFKFSVELEYRQSVAVESDFASAHNVGNTSAYAGPIAGYEFEQEGMPFFGTDESDFYNYLNNTLSEDNTLKGISKKMKARVSFEVNNKGKVNNVKIINCNHKQLCMSLSNIFDVCPDWSPATIKGKKGRAHFVIEVVYSK